MKVLTLTQPWATLVAIGAKSIETRSWSTAYRGLLAIHAGKGFPRGFGKSDCWALCLQEPFFSALTAAGITDLRQLPLGQILAVTRLVDVVPTEQLLAGGRVGQRERAFGDYSAGRFAWLLEDLRPLAIPITYTGALGLPDLRPGDAPALTAAGPMAAGTTTPLTTS
jgi:hypothetical protein